MESFSFGSRSEKKPLPDLTPEEEKESKKLLEEYQVGVKAGEIIPASKNKIKRKAYGLPSIGEVGEGEPVSVVGENETDEEYDEEEE
jgi:hypothetical protein